MNTALGRAIGPTMFGYGFAQLVTVFELITPTLAFAAFFMVSGMLAALVRSTANG